MTVGMGWLVSVTLYVSGPRALMPSALATRARYVPGGVPVGTVKSRVFRGRRLLAEADEKARGYDEALRKGAVEAIARKRRVMEESSRAGRKQVEVVVEETNRKVEELKGRIDVEKESAAALLRAQVSQLSMEIARKVLGRPVA